MPKISATKRDQRRRQILDAALACFSENGFHQTGMTDVVSRSGLSHGAVYLYFPSKDDLIAALAVDRHAQEAVLNSLALHSPDPVENLRALVRAYARSLVDPTGEARRRVGVNGWAEALRNERVKQAVVEGFDAPAALIAALIERAQADNKISADVDAATFGRVLVALFQGFVLQAVWGKPIDVKISVNIIERMLGGLASPAATASAAYEKNAP